jgi:two-component system, chemotaxis family, chemotaxis protein CheY
MLRLLLVDDSASTRAYVASILSTNVVGKLAYCELELAPTGFDALRLLAQMTYDLVLSDINMPDIHGLDILQFARKSKRHASTPVVVISTQGSDRDVRRAMELGATAFLKKPFPPEALVHTLEAALLEVQS